MIPITTHVATFKKLDPDNTDADKEGWVNVTGLEAVNVNMQPVTKDLAQVATGVFQDTRALFAPVTCSGVNLGYKVTLSGLWDGQYSKEFKVTEINDWRKGMLPHYEFLVKQMTQ